jgi:hypothetical protein
MVKGGFDEYHALIPAGFLQLRIMQLPLKAGILWFMKTVFGPSYKVGVTIFYL